MTALGKLLRTTAFKLTLVYLLIFVLFAASLLGYFALNTRRLITEQITATVDWRDQRAVRAICAGRHPASGDRRRSALAASGIEPLSGDHADRGGARRQCRLAGAGRARSSGLARNQLSPARSAGRQRPSRLGPRSCSCPAVFAFWSAATSKSASGCSASSPMPGNGRWRSSSCSGLPADSSSAGACSAASMP